MSKGWTDDQLAARVAQDIPEGACVNLGIGLPTKIPFHVPKDREVLFHSENGIIGMGPDPGPGELDPDVVNAGKKHVTLMPGAAIVHQADSFSLIRSGRLDAVVLGGLQVAANGDLANWRVPGAGVGGVGGAMDLAVGARKVLVMMRHQDKNGRSKLVKRCTFPLTAPGCVTRVYTDMGVFDCVDGAFVIRELAPGVSKDDVRNGTDAPLVFA
jgi:3-oxoadipate CoA-transferase beta subunit